MKTKRANKKFFKWDGTKVYPMTRADEYPGILKTILNEKGRPQTLLSSDLKKLFIRHTAQIVGYYEFSFWLEAFGYLKATKGKTMRKLFKPDYKKIDAYEQTPVNNF